MLKFIIVSLLYYQHIYFVFSHTPGTVTLDKFTFDKIIETFDVVLVKFDERTARGEKQDQFRKFAKNVASVKNLLLAEIPLAAKHDIGRRPRGPRSPPIDHEAIENIALAKRFNVQSANYPVYKLFLKGTEKPLDYNDAKTATALKRFLKQHTNLWFGLPGTLKQMDSLARQYFDLFSMKNGSNDEDKQILLEKAREEVKSMEHLTDKKNGESYIKIMEQILKQGTDFLKREERRIQNLLKGKITTEKKEELNNRQNILLSFISVKENVSAETLSDMGKQVKDVIKDATETIQDKVVDMAEGLQESIKNKVNPEL
ncbi:unnamed protein product [Didymodactylos carnosus]|uniref:Uncharacterized protein n=1 Tax=Didymodactylos carnosus TaxID=1234261 RepID=A0A815TKB3_9BILA|nr:unnamed protein product [Didymodactylos carnosus]CAF1506339.1 unnamed protein product [Didymodactylos carnosus]CAF4041180.1 unnamed protein product [Didymodactylos carnosus]CAF4367641.1 unnamed protein product [Didymodactylos carnosus]